MVSELSVLIPVYNQPVIALVEALLQQARSLTIPFEVRVYDDGSNQEIKKQNRACRNLPEVTYLELPQNVGRSQIRYQLATEAAFHTLLFLDNDVLPASLFFLQKYVQQGQAPVVAGGVTYADTYPAEAVLRWKYGRAREQATSAERQKNPYQRLFFSNMLVSKTLFLENFLAAQVQGYGHEDTLFAWRLQEKGLPVQHLENPVVHLGLEPGPLFLLKADQAVYNLARLHRQLGKDSRLFQVYCKAKKWGAVPLLQQSNTWLLPMLKQQLLSQNPRLWCFDLYRLLLLTRYLQKQSLF
ncbi:glycosyltransferase family 2 protein [Rufibacter quisquiliarum]|uniref:Glycosyltransferase 2-like domain-containing protein n=1 Tax=Rufibacter quisquiliarum TaxID=1549639 RepID=A0A839GVE0_9BACT|nr:glycosyltransferase [Rufibacter quisquiliarum]MBA9079445.1 hypothetical protein [Rufibacter quisquiliarum]